MDVKINERFVRQMMLDRSLDQFELAELAGISEPTMIRLLKGKSFSSGTLGKLAVALECSPVDLLDNSGFPDPHMVAPAVGGQYA